MVLSYHNHSPAGFLAVEGEILMPQTSARPEGELYREEKEHGSALFPFNIYPCTIPDDFDSVPLHWQNSMELI